MQAIGVLNNWCFIVPQIKGKFRAVLCLLFVTQICYCNTNERSLTTLYVSTRHANGKNACIITRK